MALSLDEYREAVAARRSLTVAETPRAVNANLRSLSDVGWDGEYVTPIQITSASLIGPMLVLNNWYGWKGLASLNAGEAEVVRKLGYRPGIRTNVWLDRALDAAGLSRNEVYITQACALLPPEVTGSSLPISVLRYSAEQVLSREIGNRVPLALGGNAQKACAHIGIKHLSGKHPSFQNGAHMSEIVDHLRALTT